MSLALEVCRMAEVHLGGRDATQLRIVAIEIGDDANVEVENFRFCLEALLDSAPFAGARPTIISRSGPDLRLAYLELDDDGPDY